MFRFSFYFSVSFIDSLSNVPSTTTDVAISSTSTGIANGKRSFDAPMEGWSSKQSPNLSLSLLSSSKKKNYTIPRFFKETDTPWT